MIMYTHSEIFTKTTLADFLISEIVKLKIKIDSIISNKNIRYYSKLPIPIMHG